MRVAVVLVLALASLSLTAAAQQHHRKITGKPSRQDSAGKSTVPARVPNADSGVARELRMAEQSGAKAGVGKGAVAHRRVAPVKMEREKANPPIRFGTAASTGHAVQNNQGTNPYKSRLKQKHGGK
jgi:hypothetical protein